MQVLHPILVTRQMDLVVMRVVGGEVSVANLKKPNFCLYQFLKFLKPIFVIAGAVGEACTQATGGVGTG